MDLLPVDLLLPELAETLWNAPTVILEAPPGSGKSTRVAPSLIDAGLCDSQRRVFLLQPRRVAARATAQRISEERQWQMGREIGYQVRFENRSTESTPLVVATEGILLRRLNNDPVLSGVGTVVLDEFHERSLNADLLLGMLRRIQDVVRNDLKLIIMSATLNTATLVDALQAPVLSTTGTLHPVDIKYRPPRPRQNILKHVVDTVAVTLEKTDGDLLVFLPGMGEIHRVQRDLEQHRATQDCDILPLHGSLPLEQQNRVLYARGRRRIVLATNVAETSLTIEGIRHVIDSGQVRVLRYDPNVGLDRLQLESICQNSAAQRAGRAGRLAHGTCIRLWNERTHRARPQALQPEIRRVDLCAAVLQLYQWGEKPDGDFPWLETPRAESLARARDLLAALGAVSNGQLTDVGRRMAELPIAPRLARMLIEAQAFDAVPTMALVAAMLSERDPFLKSQPTSGSRPPTRRQARWHCDLTQRFLAINQYFQRRTAHSPFGEIHQGAARIIQRVAHELTNYMGVQLGTIESTDQTEEQIQRCLLAAFPDRLARRRKPQDARGRMVGGRGVRLAPTSGVMDAEYFLCIDVDAGQTEASVRLASGVDLAWLPAGAIETREEQFFNPSRKQVEARRRGYFRDLLLAEAPVAISDEAQCHEILLREATKQVSAVLPNEKSAFHSYVNRWNCLRDWAPDLELPACDDKILAEIAEELCAGRRSFAQLRDAPWLDWLRAKLSDQQQQAIEKECPERITIPNGSRKLLQYTVGKPPVLAARIQEIFSWTNTPCIAFGRQPVLLHLLAPNMRPQQITDDLASFWENTYPVIRKELRRRYPKHAWPEDPLTAKPTR